MTTSQPTYATNLRDDVYNAVNRYFNALEARARRYAPADSHYQNGHLMSLVHDLTRLAGWAGELEVNRTAAYLEEQEEKELACERASE
jgi:hypothetical protein